MGLNTYYNPGTPGGLLLVGDSKSDTVNAWPGKLLHSLYREGVNYTQRPFGCTQGGITVAGMVTLFDTALPAAVGSPNAILCNLGANNISVLPVEATLKADYLTILDALNAKWPGVPVYVARVWVKTRDANCDTYAGWLADIVAARPTFAHLGHDERVWMKGADDGATMSNDGTHYTAAGQTECAAQWLTVLGF